MTTLRLQPALEESIRRIPGVRAASVVTSADAHPTEVHVLTVPGKPAKQVVRDVQSLALAQHELDLDHRIVSVVQIGDDDGTTVPSSGVPGPASTAAVARAAITSTGVRSTPEGIEVSVSLATGPRDDDHVVTGTATGPAGAAQRARVVAEAALDAVRELLGHRCAVDSAQVVTAGTRQVAVTVLSLWLPRVGEHVLSGSAPVRSDEVDAVARSVLDALNRQLTG